MKTLNAKLNIALYFLQKKNDIKLTCELPENSSDIVSPVIFFCNL